MEYENIAHWQAKYNGFMKKNIPEGIKILNKRIFGVMNSFLAQLYHNIELPAYQHMKHCT